CTGRRADGSGGGRGRSPPTGSQKWPPPSPPPFAAAVWASTPSARWRATWSSTTGTTGSRSILPSTTPLPSAATARSGSGPSVSCAGPSAATTAPGTTACSWTCSPRNSPSRRTAHVAPATATYPRDTLPPVHPLGSGSHADLCAPGLIDLLRPVREHDGLVVEIGCGSGLLTRHLVDAGPRVVATDASPAMLDLARDVAPAAEDARRLVLPAAPLPPPPAVAAVGP